MLSQCSLSIISSLYNCILSWKAKLPFPMKTTPERHRTGECQSGLKTLLPPQAAPIPRILHRFKTMETTEAKPASPPPPSSLSWLWSQSSPPFRTTTMMGDVIGAESGDFMVSDIDEFLLYADSQSRKMSYKERKRSKREKRELPPPITPLRETGKMPWEMKTERSDDGRLIVTKERTRWHNMEARRENGKLTITTFAEHYFCEECGNSVEDEVGDFEFNQDFESVDEEKEGFEFEFDFEAEVDKDVSNESVQRGEFDQRQCVTFDDAGPGFGLRRLLQYSDSFPDIYLGRPASAPLRPVTSVM